MKLESGFIAGLILLLSACGVRGRAPGQPSPESQVIRPDKLTSFANLYQSNCAGCHGTNGRGGPAQSLGDPIYLGFADDSTIRRVVRNGISGTSMPAFAESAGGTLTNQQIDAIVAGIRAEWAKPETIRGMDPPPYAADHAGDAKRGAGVYAIYCTSCHGAKGQGGRASSIVDGSYLALVSDQSLRTTVVVGRPELGAPDFRGNVPGKRMSAEDVSDVVAWLVAQRLEVPGQPYPAKSKPIAVGETQ